MLLSRRELQTLVIGGAGFIFDGPAAAQTTAPAIPPLVPLTNLDFEPRGGQPPQGATPSVAQFGTQINYHRAFEAVLWAMPAVAIYRFRAAAMTDLGLRDNDIIAYSGAATPLLEATTANSSTPYITAFSNLQDGPTVLEVPQAGPEGSLYGQVVDAWQYTIADIGPSGLDKGAAAKYLFTPPGYDGAVPEGYLHVPSPNFRIAFALRSVRAEGKTASDAYDYAKRLRMYRLREAANPPAQTFIDPLHSRYSTLPFYDERHFRDIYDIVSVEPVKAEDKVMMGMLASLGIQRGKAYAPDAATTQILRQAAIDAWFYMQQWYDEFPADQLFWPDRHYASLLQADSNDNFTWSYDDRIDLTARAAEYFWCTYMPKKLTAAPATQYLMALADSKGRSLQPGQTYRLDIPAKMPVKQFWALTVYDRATMGFIYTSEVRTTLSSYDVEGMKKNADGGVSIFIGPAAPNGMAANWIPTSGKRPLPAMRLYGPTDAVNQRIFKLPDFVLVS